MGPSVRHTGIGSLERLVQEEIKLKLLENCSKSGKK